MLLLTILASSCGQGPLPPVAASIKQQMLVQEGECVVTNLGHDAYQLSSMQASGCKWHGYYVIKGVLDKEAFDFRNVDEWMAFIARYSADEGSTVEPSYGELGRIINNKKGYKVNSSLIGGSYSSRIYYTKAL